MCAACVCVQRYIEQEPSQSDNTLKVRAACMCNRFAPATVVPPYKMQREVTLYAGLVTLLAQCVATLYAGLLAL